MRPPAGAEIAAPEFPPRMEWLNVAFLRMDRLLGRSCVLIEFFDTARINSHRTLPYLKGWHDRYADHGLRIVGVHSPAYSFGRDREVVERAVEALGIEYAVLLDPSFEVWRLYGNKGWPARYLFDRRGLLRYVHYGEGDYTGAERAIGELVREIDPDVTLPEPLPPIRPEDATGALLEAQTADVVLPGERHRLKLVRDWRDGEDFIEAADAGAAASVRFTAGGAWSVLSGPLEPGLYETDGTVVAPEPGLRLHGFQFTPGFSGPRSAGDAPATGSRSRRPPARGSGSDPAEGFAWQPRASCGRRGRRSRARASCRTACNAGARGEEPCSLARAGFRCGRARPRRPPRRLGRAGS